MRRALIALFLALACTSQLAAWGERGHHTANRAAVRAIPDDGPTFLRAHEEWIVYLSTVPDSWRSASEPFQKIIEDPNHGWFREQFAFMTNANVPRSRYEFVLALDQEHRRLAAAGDDKAASLTNIRWTGTLPYAAVETYEQMVAGMRRYRAARAQNADTRLIELEIASYLGRLGHYTADGAQPSRGKPATREDARRAGAGRFGRRPKAFPTRRCFCARTTTCPKHAWNRAFPRWQICRSAPPVDSRW